MVDRVEKDKTKYLPRKYIVEHTFGAIKRSMNFTYLLLGNLTKVKGGNLSCFLFMQFEKSNQYIGFKRDNRVYLFDFI
ncbi:hypothetical protein [Terrisporobacter vanillatitrophus]|uniref:hypothetical protein n=1 Tax=Terrisporobacter vanillatitrophus TaxID=3058402 RepID=UPI003369568E